MQPAPPRPALLLGVDAILACGVQVLEGEDIEGCAPTSCGALC
jgi:hypothetical protein